MVRCHVTPSWFDTWNLSRVSYNLQLIRVLNIVYSVGIVEMEL